jgi:hypothetical protein
VKIDRFVTLVKTHWNMQLRFHFITCKFYQMGTVFPLYHPMYLKIWWLGNCTSYYLCDFKSCPCLFFTLKKIWSQYHLILLLSSLLLPFINNLLIIYYFSHCSRPLLSSFTIHDAHLSNTKASYSLNICTFRTEVIRITWKLVRNKNLLAPFEWEVLRQWNSAVCTLISLPCDPGSH